MNESAVIPLLKNITSYISSALISPEAGTAFLVSMVVAMHGLTASPTSRIQIESVYVV